MVFGCRHRWGRDYEGVWALEHGQGVCWMVFERPYRGVYGIELSPSDIYSLAGHCLSGLGRESIDLLARFARPTCIDTQPLRKAFLEYANTTVMFADTRSDTDAARILKHAVRGYSPPYKTWSQASTSTFCIVGWDDGADDRTGSGSRRDLNGRIASHGGWDAKCREVEFA